MQVSHVIRASWNVFFNSSKVFFFSVVYRGGGRHNITGSSFLCAAEPRRFRLKTHRHTQSLHCHKVVAEKRSMAHNVFLAVRAAMIEEDLDLVAVDLKGVVGRGRMEAGQQNDSTLEETFKKRQAPLTTWPHTVVEPWHSA